MKSLILLISVFLVNTVCFANPTFSNQHISHNDLGFLWKTHPSLKSKSNEKDITIVYGGDDISHKPTLITHTALV